MSKLALIIVASLAAGFAVAAWFLGPAEKETPVGSTAGNEFDSRAGIEERLSALESAVSAERQARQLLEEELFSLYETLDEFEDPELPEEAATVSADDRDPRQDFRDQSGGNRRNDKERRLQALAAAGFSESRAEWIVQREAELRMQAMQERFEAMRSGEAQSPRSRFRELSSALRDEIGDVEYEMYLEASGRPTSIGVRSVLEASPAFTAGLQPGDRITHYDGVRVYSTADLTRQAMQGEPGQSVVVNIVRDGAPMQALLPYGPLGITAGRRR